MSRVTSLDKKEIVINDDYPLSYKNLLCPLCNSIVASTNVRLAELPAEKQELDNKEAYCRAYQAIGISYTHINGTMCDKEYYKLEKL